MTSDRQINAIDATDGAAAVGDGARAVHVGAGGTYIEQQTVVIQERPRVEPNRFQVPFPHSDHFVGREDDLAQIHALLSGSERRPVGLCGLGGIGKTQLAVEYAYHHRSEYSDGIFWLTAADPWTWQAGLAEIATRLGLAVPDPDKSDAQMRLAGELAAYLNGHPNALLIFDNVEEPADLNVSRVQGFIFAALGCRALFTTRRRAADLPFAWLEVGRLPEDASLALLLRHESRRLALDPGHPDHPAARELCRRLGYLPLTLELAAAFLARNLKVTIPAYLARIGKEGVLATVDRTHLRPEDLPTGHEPSIVTTLAMQWEALADDAARCALQTAALLPEAEQIPRARLALLTGLPDTAEEGYASPLEDTLASLHDLSLAEELTADEVRLHPLVREFAAGQIADRDAFVEAAVTEMSEALWNVERLEAEVRDRKVDAVVADLRAAAALVATCPALAEVPGTSTQRLHPLLRALDLDSHILRRWNPETEPAFFLQQWRNRCFEMGWDEPVRQAEALLAARRLPYLRELRRLGTEDPALLRTLVGHTDGVRAVALTPDGHTMVSGSHDHTLKVWDLASGACLRTLEGHTADVDAVAVSPDGRTAVSGASDQTLKVWDLASGACLRTLKGHTADVDAVAVSPHGRTAVSGASDHTLKVWDLASGACTSTLKGDSASVHAMSIASNGRTAISWATNHSLTVWNLNAGTCRHVVTEGAFPTSGIATAPDGHTAVWGNGRTIEIWDLDTGTRLHAIREHNGPISAVALAPDGRTAVSGAFNGEVKIWDVLAGICLSSLAGHSTIVESVTISLNGTIVVAAASDGTVKIWDLTASSRSCIRADPVGSVMAVALKPNNCPVAVSRSRDRIWIWDSVAGASLQTIPGRTDSVSAIALAPDGSIALSGHYDGSLLVWDVTTHTCLHTLVGHKHMVCPVAVTTDGHTAIAASYDTLKVWDLAGGTCRHTLADSSDTRILAVAIAPDGRLAASGARSILHIWDLMTGRCLYSLTSNPSPICAVAAAADGQTIVSGSADGTLSIWDMITGTCSRIIVGHGNIVRMVAVAPDRRIAVSGADDCTFKVWDLDTGACMARLHAAEAFRSCVIAPNDGRVVAGDALGGVHFIEWVRWD